MIWRDGTHWGTAAELAAALGPDVTAAMVRRWRDRKGLTTRAGYSPLDEAAAIELATRTSTRGRPRRLDLAAAGTA
ncbi:hypothetical protein [Micromonospora haikouensis]|uniref:hypothetical protein n=1 Tax=Micromonospora haikouensis TaxID=686309 RepID=UPI003D70418D